MEILSCEIYDDVTNLEQKRVGSRRYDAPTLKFDEYRIRHFELYIFYSSIKFVYFQVFVTEIRHDYGKNILTRDRIFEEISWFLSAEEIARLHCFRVSATIKYWEYVLTGVCRMSSNI